MYTRVFYSLCVCTHVCFTESTTILCRQFSVDNSPPTILRRKILRRKIHRRRIHRRRIHRRRIHRRKIHRHKIHRRKIHRCKIHRRKIHRRKIHRRKIHRRKIHRRKIRRIDLSRSYVEKRRVSVMYFLLLTKEFYYCQRNLWFGAHIDIQVNRRRILRR